MDSSTVTAIATVILAVCAIITLPLLVLIAALL